MTMKRLTVRSRALVGTSALCLASVLRLSAQTTAPQTGLNQTEETPLELSPFVVQAEEDTGYAAKDTLAGTRIRTDLKDVGSAIQVVTQKFLQDTNSRNSSDLLVLTTNTEVAAQGGNYTGGGDGAVIDTTAYTKPVANTRVRGLAEADNLRDFFLTDIPWDSYNVGRVDLQRGPNSILFGIGSPAGIINSSLNQAMFRDANKLEYQFGTFGTGRFTADFNKVIMKDTLAIRIALLDDQVNYKQKPAYRNDERFYGAVRFDPKLVKNGNTSIRANYESGDIHANYPRLTPPMDSITPWFNTMNKAAIPYQDNNNLTTFGNAAYNPYLGAAGNRIWDGLAGTFENNNPGLGYLIAASVVNFPAPAGGEEWRNNTVNGSYKGIQAYDSYAFNARLPGYVIKPFKAKSLTDASIFDYYNNLIEGDNKKSTNTFEAYNFTASQTFLDDRIGVELAYDKQDSKWGYRNAVSGDAAAISIDVMSTQPNGAPNPNFGRPMVIMGGGSAGSGWTNKQRENFRATAFGKFDFGDVMDKKSKLAQALGVHNFTVAYSDYQDDTFQKNWVNWYIGGGYGPVANTAVGQAGRDITPIIYLGSNAVGRTSASGLGLGRVTVDIVPPAASTVTQWDTTIPGFRSYAVPIVAPNEDDGPYTNAVKSQNQIDSKIFVWQGQLFGGNLVPMFGWREDEATNRDAGAPNKTLGLVTDIDSPTWVLPEEGTVVKGTTRTYSLVAKVPQSIMAKLPGQMGFQVFYNKSENFQPDASRKDILGDPIPAPTGKTEEYGFTISMLDNRVSLKVNRYETSVTNATISGELGNSYLIGAGEAWGQAAAYHLKQNDGIWPGDGNYGTTSSGQILRWQPSDDPANHVIPGDNSSPYTQAAIDAQYAIQVASTNDWYAHLIPQKMQQAWGMTGYDTGSGSWSMNTVAVTGDTLSKGTEFELVASNVWVKGLDVALNASKTDARRLNIGKAYSDWIEQRYEDYKGPMGEMRLWGNGNWALQKGAGGTVRDKFENEVIPNYMLALALNGSNVSELRPWRFNITTNYTWQNGGILKGSNAGFSYRWQDKQVTGYKLNSTLDGYDIGDPYYGPSEDAFDFWVGYERKISAKINWRIQGNVRNVFASKDLIPITVQPDGSPGAYRIPEPLTWSITNSFSF